MDWDSFGDQVSQSGNLQQSGAHRDPANSASSLHSAPGAAKHLSSPLPQKGADRKRVLACKTNNLRLKKSALTVFIIN